MIRLFITFFPIICAFIIFFDVLRYKSLKTALAVAIPCAFFPLGPFLYLLFRSRFIVQVAAKQSFCSRCGYSSLKSVSECPKCHNQLVL